MNILAIETTSTSGSIAISSNSIIKFSSFIDLKITHSERLMPQIDYGLKQCNFRIKDIDLLAVSNGPGSFTGVRIGLSTAKGIATALRIPLIPFNTLEILAYQMYPSQLSILSIIDARMSEVYAAMYDSEMNSIWEPFHISPENLIKRIDEKIVIVGSGFVRFAELFKESNVSYKVGLSPTNMPMATTMIGIIENNFEIPKFDYDKIAKLEPNYLRKSQAEINYLERKK
ncbi:MAG: tRNA (adenosine(37)-N6)-threonylcarbamoyltransferase complex dimerization subunit type 1 TsaB [Candidatus Cloacimonadota bacterium]|nr:tRNA (adenosine(37)-N6)-threonylcarbamoyltransferase complex dimerization subunit type 1 TsaB [Candidatus Cloacimonadota bacterium]